MADKPVFKPEWATDDVVLPVAGTDNKKRPEEPTRLTGYDYTQKAPVQEWNWMWNNIYEWVEYFESTTDAIGITDIASQTEAELGSINTALMTPLRTKQYSDQYGIGGSKRLSGNNMDDLVKSGFYYVTSSLNLPSGNTEGHVIVTGTGVDGEVMQRFTSSELNISNDYQNSWRIKNSAGTWSSWYSVNSGEPLSLDPTTTNLQNYLGHSHEIDMDSFFDNSEVADQQLIAGDGYQKLPGGLIIQWGTTTIGDDAGKNITLPLEMPNAGLSVVASSATTTQTPNFGQTLISARFVDNTSIRIAQASVGNYGSFNVNWIAIGY